MKLVTAQKYIVELNRRVHSINGILATPLCRFSAVKINRLWVFGSTIKGSLNPNDLDIWIDMETCGKHFTWRQTTISKEGLRRFGIRTAPDSANYAMKWLTRGMKKVSRHWSQVDEVKLDKKILIYPRMDYHP